MGSTFIDVKACARISRVMCRSHFACLLICWQRLSLFLPFVCCEHWRHEHWWTNTCLSPWLWILLGVHPKVECWIKWYILHLSFSFGSCPADFRSGCNIVHSHQQSTGFCLLHIHLTSTFRWFTVSIPMCARQSLCGGFYMQFHCDSILCFFCAFCLFLNLLWRNDYCLLLWYSFLAEF